MAEFTEWSFWVSNQHFYALFVFTLYVFHNILGLFAVVIFGASTNYNTLIVSFSPSSCPFLLLMPLYCPRHCVIRHPQYLFLFCPSGQKAESHIPTEQQVELCVRLIAITWSNERLRIVLIFVLEDGVNRLLCCLPTCMIALFMLI
jgi:hypothetical protein